MTKQAKQSSAKKSVIIVEDSEDFSNLLKFIVEDEGLEGIQLPLYEEDIVAWAKKHKPCLFFMDLALRRKGGLEYISDLKGDPATKQIPVVILTGRDLGHREVMELELKGVKYLRKGRVEMEVIRKVIRDAADIKDPAAPAEKSP
jgi:DNA-binding response OmpR family regulator